jgi:hypothetical protein
MTVRHETPGTAATEQIPRTRGRGRNGPVIATRVIPVAWVTALALADGDPARLRVISASEIIVTNNPGRRL